MGLPAPGKLNLYSKISGSLDSLKWTDANHLMSLVKADKTLQEKVEAGIRSFISEHSAPVKLS